MAKLRVFAMYRYKSDADRDAAKLRKLGKSARVTTAKVFYKKTQRMGKGYTVWVGSKE